MSRTDARSYGPPRLTDLLEALGRWFPGARGELAVDLEGDSRRGIEPEPLEVRVAELRAVQRKRTLRFVGPVLDALSEAVSDRREAPAPLRRAVELTEDVVALSQRGRSDRASSVADALREATSRLGGEDACRIRLRLPVDGLVVAGPQRLQVVAELALRHGLLASSHRVVDACLTEEGGLVHMYVAYGEPTGDPWLHHVYLGLLLGAVAPLDGAVLVHDGGVEVQLDRFTLVDELLGRTAPQQR